MIAITQPTWTEDPFWSLVLMLIIILIFTPATTKCSRKKK